MKDKIKKIFTIVLIIFAVLFGFSWVKSCNNAKDIKTYENVAQMRQKAPKRANEEENNKDYIIFDSNIIDKIVIDREEYISEDNKVIVDLWYHATDYEYDLKIYFKKGYAYQETTNINDNFIFSTLNEEDQAFNVSSYTSGYNYSTMHINYEYDSPDIAQVTTITLKEDLIRHNFDYLTNKSIILNSSLSSQFGDNILKDSYIDLDEQINGQWQNALIINVSSLENNQTYTLSFNAITSGSVDIVCTCRLNDNTYTNERWNRNVSNNQLISYTFTKTSNMNYVWVQKGDSSINTLKTNNKMINKGSYALPYRKYIDISQYNDKVRLLTKDSNLNDRTFATYFFSNSYKPLIPRYNLTPIISLENNELGFSIGQGIETSVQKIYDYTSNAYYNAYGLIPRTLSFTNQFTHDNLECAVLNYYQEGYADYENEILMTEYLLNNSHNQLY